MPSNSIVFIDSRVANYQSLIDSLAQPYEVFILDGDEDGLNQMAGYLKGRGGLDAIHVISHGSQGALYLGSTVLNGDNFGFYQTQLSGIGGSLTQTGDILLYGCHVAHGDVGMQFITSLAQVTGADVAGSDDATGTAELGGNWVLERGIGSLEAANLPIDGYAGLLAGNTEPTFAPGDGMVAASISGDFYRRSVSVQSDGKILLAGSSQYGELFGFALLRYNQDGSLDATFGNDGLVTTPIGDSLDTGRSVTMQSDGKILAVGNDHGRFVVVRYNTNGSLDASFGSDGVVMSTGTAYSVAVQTDNNILIGGGASKFMVARYNSDGTLDTSFGTDGTVSTLIGSLSSTGYDVVVQTDGKILLGGTTTTKSDFGDYLDFALVRYNPNGSLDTSFGIGGKVTTDFDASNNITTLTGTDRSESVAIQADGKILMAGYSYVNATYNFALARYNFDGNLDATFGNDGKVTTNFDSSTGAFGTSITVQSDGKILVAGYFSNGTLGIMGIVRYDSNGSLDSSFGIDGKVETSVSAGQSSSGVDVTVQADGKILVADAGFGLVRYNSNGSLDLTFDAVNTLDAHPTYTGYNAVILDDNVRILDVELQNGSSYGGSTLMLNRHHDANVNDVFSAKTSGTLSALTSGSFFSVGAVTIGRVVSNGNGKLELGFNSNATQALVSAAMQQIAYANTASIPSAQVQIDWTFNDGNTGAQGSGGALAATGSTVVNITARNVAPVVSNGLKDCSILPNAPINVVLSKDAFFDANKDDPLIFSINMSDGTALPTWLTFNADTRTLGGNPGTLGIFDLNAFDIKVTATDIAGATASDIFRLSVTNGTLTGNNSNEVFNAGTGNDAIDGGSGNDTVILIGVRSAHTIMKTSAGWIINSPTGGTDTIQNVERLKFNDATVALDIDGNGGQAYRVYQAAFNRTPDSGGLGFWINTMDSGASLRNVAEGFVGSAEFKALYGTNPTNAQIVTKLYDNVLHRAGETGGFNFWLGVLDSKADTLAGVLAAFSESAENQAGLVGVIGNGFAFTPYA